jgi:GT2 family glycosyltransferase
MKLSVILLTWNSANDVKLCLDSVLDSTAHIECEVIVLDNHSEDGTLELLKQYKDRILLIRNTGNQGVARGRNRALLKATGEFIWILDIDTVVNRQAVDAMLSHLETVSETGICGCKLRSLQGEVQDSCRQMPSLRYKFLNILIALLERCSAFAGFRDRLMRWNNKQFYHQQMQGSQSFEVGYLIGACQMFRRSVLSAVGYLDEHIFYGPEDADFCLRIRNVGFKVIYLPHVSIVHHYMRISNKHLFSRMSFLHLKAIIYFLWKNRGRL